MKITDNEVQTIYAIWLKHWNILIDIFLGM